MRPLATRVLFVDDEVFGGTVLRQVVRDPQVAFESNYARAQEGIQLVIRELRRFAQDRALIRPLELYAARGVRPRHKVAHLTAATPGEAQALDGEFLRSLAAIVLDVEGLGDLSPPLEAGHGGAWQHLPEPSVDDLAELGGRYSGIGFFLRNERHLRNCSVFFCTKHDGGRSEPRVVRRFLNPLPQHFSTGRPHVAKFPSNRAELLIGPLRAIVQANASEFIFRYGGHDIQVAANHHGPVLVVGETGTGKEGVALSIHTEWTHRWESDGPIHVVNCAGLEGQKARAELFGHVHGAFTGAEFHNPGTVLSAIGVQKISEKTKGPVGFHQGLVKSLTDLDIRHEANLARLSIDIHPLEVPPATLFLDEFAELDLQSQTLLLRFLQGGEIQPLGYPGRIRGLDLRIIVATSDPRVAAFARVKRFHGGQRTDAELRRPLREDLLFRVAFQTIRTHPVTPDNAAEVVEVLVAGRRHGSVRWTKAAKAALAEKAAEASEAATQHLSSNSLPSESIAGRGTEARREGTTSLSQWEGAFGHYRQLKRLIDLAGIYASTGGRRGDPSLRRRQVTRGLIEKLWSPSPARSPLSTDIMATRAAGGTPRDATDALRGLRGALEARGDFPKLKLLNRLLDSPSLDVLANELPPPPDDKPKSLKQRKQQVSQQVSKLRHYLEEDDSLRGFRITIGKLHGGKSCYPVSFKGRNDEIDLLVQGPGEVTR